MIRRPPRSTRTDTLFPYTTLCRSGLATAYAAFATVWPESLPAPAISRLVQIDEKLRFLRQHPGLDPEVLAVGSSITWRQIDGDAFSTSVDGDDGRFLNGGTGMHIGRASWRERGCQSV